MTEPLLILAAMAGGAGGQAPPNRVQQSPDQVSLTPSLIALRPANAAGPGYILHAPTVSGGAAVWPDGSFGLVGQPLTGVTSNDDYAMFVGAAALFVPPSTAPEPPQYATNETGEADDAPSAWLNRLGRVAALSSADEIYLKVTPTEMYVQCKDTDDDGSPDMCVGGPDNGESCTTSSDCDRACAGCTGACAGRSSQGDLSGLVGSSWFLGPPRRYADPDISELQQGFVASELVCFDQAHPGPWTSTALANAPADDPEDDPASCVDGTCQGGADDGDSCSGDSDCRDADTSTIYFFGEPIAPCSSYEVRFCFGNDPATCTTPVVIYTGRFGDVAAPFSAINFTDIQRLVDKFRSRPFPSAPYKPRALLRADQAPVGSLLNFTDIQNAVDAFRDRPFSRLTHAQMDDLAAECSP